MTRLIQTAAILALLVATAAHAETARLAYNPADLATPAGVDAVKAKIAGAAETYCRANPVGRTVLACRQDVEAQLSRSVDARAVKYAKSRQIQFARR